MSRVALTSVIALISLFLVSCAVTPTPRPSVRLTLAGADSMQWLARALANDYTQQHPNVTINIQAANSEMGLRAASQGPETIGMISRTIMPRELSQARAVVVARDGIAVIVNVQNPINAIQATQIAQVFSGDILTWPTGPSAGKAIVVVSREEGSGTRNAFETMVMNQQRVTRTAVVMPTEAAVLDYVAQNPEAIGYTSMGALTPQVRALAVDDVYLSPETVESQTYPLMRTLTFVVPLDPAPELQAFVDFALGADGQAIIGQRYGRAP
ncbi:MAG: phosphate ABC transporter substrate-binding protein [Chloroflexi bacterium]|nr:phosphate ABC transporter substrate-binding protein [Chloroflexota bacterium]